MTRKKMSLCEALQVSRDKYFGERARCTHPARLPRKNPTHCTRHAAELAKAKDRVIRDPAAWWICLR